MDCRLTTRDGQEAVEWTWAGNDEADPAQGRGRARPASAQSAASMTLDALMTA